MSAVAWKIRITVPGTDDKPAEVITVATEGAKLWQALDNVARQGVMPDARKANIEIEVQG